MYPHWVHYFVAETQGFEPWSLFTGYLVSSEALSTTQPRLQYLKMTNFNSTTLFNFFTQDYGFVPSRALPYILVKASDIFALQNRMKYEVVHIS